MLITVVTLFPKIFDSVFSHSIVGRAQKDKTITIETLDLRDFGIGRHKVVDDTSYGGGTGMVLRVDVVDSAIEAARNKSKKGDQVAVILLDPKGKVYKQSLAEEFSGFDHLILICGRYEGFDERIRTLVDYELSVGDYVTSGGEIPAMIIIESVARLVKGVIPKDEATDLESFSEIDGKRILEYPQYTKPLEYKSMKVPEVLLSGDFKKINEYRKSEAEKVTKQRRPDLVK
jgi:tRNA (guanine37-N1)-methyltransferase